MDRVLGSVQGLGKPDEGDVFDMTSDVIRAADGRCCQALADEYAGLISAYGHRVEHGACEVPEGVRQTGDGA